MFFLALITSTFFIGSPPNSSLTTKMKIQTIIFVSIYVSLPLSIFILLLLNINEQCNINLINYLKCLIFSIVFSAIIFFLSKNGFRSEQSTQKYKKYKKY